MIGRKAARSEDKSPRVKRGRAPATERARKPSLLARWRARPRRSPEDYGEQALLAGYRKNASSRAAALALYAGLAIVAIAWGLMFGLSAPFQIMPMVAPFALLAFLIVWILPPGEYAPTAAIEPLYLAFFAVLLLWPNYIALALPHLPWFTLLRIVGTPLVLVLLVSISVSASVRRRLADIMNTDKALWRMLAGLVVLQTISVGLSKEPVVSLNRYIVAQMNLTAIFVVSCYLFARPGFMERWVRMLLALAFGVCAIGLWEYAISALPWAGHTPALLKIDGERMEAMLAGIQRASLGTHRVQSTQTTPLGLAELLGLAAPFAIHLLMEPRSLALRLTGAVYLPLALYMIILADSRLGIVALIGAVLFYMLIWSALRWRRSKSSLLAPALVLSYPAILTATILASFFVGALRKRVWGSGAQQSSNDSRAAQWELAIPKVITHPFGHGFGQAAGEVGYRVQGGRVTLDSYYITALMDFGIIGFILFFGLFLRAAWIGGRVVVNLRPVGEVTMLLPLAVALMNFVVIKAVLSQDANHPLAFMMLGAVVALVYRAKKEAAAVQP